jgi:hypothetical protein
METIRLSTDVYNDAKVYAAQQNVSVDEFIVSLIYKFGEQKKNKLRVKPIHQLSPILQEIANMPREGAVDDDINGDNARWKYYQEKFGL